jgi:hypothetical protein
MNLCSALFVCLLNVPSFSQNLPEIPLRFSEVKMQVHRSKEQAIAQEIFGKHAGKFRWHPISLSGIFSTYRIYFQGIPLHNAFLITRETNHESTEVLAPDFSRIKFPEPDYHPAGTRLVFDGSNWIPLSMASETSLSPPAAFRIFRDKSGSVKFSEDWLLRFSDSSVKARVFRPDPVSRLQMPYGGLLRDRGDSSSTLLRQAMDSVNIRLAFSGDSFRLKSPHLHFGEYSPPARRLSVSSDVSAFVFDRDVPGFEEVNAFWHLSRFRAFLDSLGLDSLARFPLQIDAHGMDGADQSAYSPLQEFMAFGDGNVDDAEDAAVILHEYGHVLAHAAFPFGNSGQERRALEEGICDYIAGSYLRASSSYLPDRLFRWDGNNEFWPGRSLVSNRNYPADLTGSLYADGGIFCSALSAMEAATGRKALHHILLTALYGIGPNLSMPAAARQMLIADSALYQGQHASEIRSRFLQRGIDPDLVVVSAAPAFEKDFFVFYAENGRAFIRNRAEAKVDVMLVDATGRQKAVFSCPAGVSEVPVNGLPPGIYFLRKGNDCFRLRILSDN